MQPDSIRQGEIRREELDQQMKNFDYLVLPNIGLIRGYIAEGAELATQSKNEAIRREKECFIPESGVLLKELVPSFGISC